MQKRALEVLKKYNKGEDRILHASLVAAVLEYIAQQNGADGEYWGAVGLLHDVDFEVAPGRHCAENPTLLRREGYDEEFIHAVQSHGYQLRTDVTPCLLMEKMLYVFNELVTLIYDSAMALPTHSIYDLQPRTVLQNWDVAGFTPNANRTVIQKGCKMLEMPLEDLVVLGIRGLEQKAVELNLTGASAREG